MSMGVVDPTKVTRTAVQNAASIAGLMLTTEAMVSELAEDKKGGGMEGMDPGMQVAWAAWAAWVVWAAWECNLIMLFITPYT